MITNPNTCGLFEDDIVAISAAVHDAGGFVYCDGANFNAIVGRVRPGDLGVDAMHLNLHKTFSTPHGGGGPGAGPVVLSEALAAFAPLPFVVKDGDGFRLVETEDESAARPYGRMKGFHGQFGVFVRALSYMMSMGADGLRQASADAVLNANYLRERLQNALSLSYPGPCMHEVLFDDRFLAETGITTLDFAKAMIDEGVHPMTMYFPLIVHGAFLIEPTETESRASLDQLADLMLGLVAKAKAKEVEFFKASPTLTPRRRLDETRAARSPVLRWTPPAPKMAAE
jgi:glycine dehydrogenase subunit 2